MINVYLDQNKCLPRLKQIECRIKMCAITSTKCYYIVLKLATAPLEFMGSICVVVA